MHNIGPYLSEAKYKPAVAYERGIVDKINGKEIEGVMFNRQLDRVIDSIKSNPHAPNQLYPAKHTGRQRASTSAIWKKYGGSGKQEYITDMILAGNKISLKVGKAQLFSGTQEESQALLYSVIEQKGYNDQLAEEIGQLLEGFVSGALTKAQSRKYKTISNAKKELQELMDADSFNKQARNKIQNFFSANPSLKFDIVQETLTGDLKFGGSEASADFLLAISKSGKKANYHNLNTDSSYIHKIANQAKPNITFTSALVGKKYTTKIRTYATVFRMIANKLNENLEEYGDTLNENIFQQVFLKLKQFVIKIVEVIKAQLKRGIEYVTAFLDSGLQLTMNSEVSFI